MQVVICDLTIPVERNTFMLSEFTKFGDMSKTVLYLEIEKRNKERGALVRVKRIVN
jgi:hypothetical protein